MFNFKGTCTILPENPNLNDVIIFNGKTMAYTKKAWEELMSRPTLRERLQLLMNTDADELELFKALKYLVEGFENELKM